MSIYCGQIRYGSDDFEMLGWTRKNKLDYLAYKPAITVIIEMLVLKWAYTAYLDLLYSAKLVLKLAYMAYTDLLCPSM